MSLTGYEIQVRIKNILLALENKNNNPVAELLLDEINEHADKVKIYTPDFIELIKDMAMKGNSYSQDFLGDMYYFGRGVESNKFEAIKWFRISAAKGNTHAMFNLGFMLKTVNKDLSPQRSFGNKLLVESFCLGCKEAKNYLSFKLLTDGIKLYGELITDLQSEYTVHQLGL